ncbi:deoxyribonuclease IV [Mycoplasma nasistruthionis]|uniref:Probable endonuclease 4 n=1 Tax=Mycoplasma nasistruthionis TaxID=353852 RepID=A0A4Y6I725_9MOLU|nr:deoxyribonuclease IV [Mycoplasma nasistruthionis]QDF64999.1 deoxyribonuclease IV [Mycoplasma nasistruthionis]
MIKLGSHISFKAPNYLTDSCQNALNNGANTLMIYLGAPQNTARVAVEKYNLDLYKEKYESLIPAHDIVVHAPYIINPSNPSKNRFAIDFLIDEIKRMEQAGFKYLVLHPGASVEYDVEEALDTLIDSLNEVIENTNDVVICLESMSGKGTEVGRDLEQLAHVIKWVNHDRLKICLDTCHLWDAGYDLQDYEGFKNELVKWDLLKEVAVIHLNDSKNDVRSHKDRHANIGKGYIGLETLKKFVFDKDFDNIPIILETPIPEDNPNIYADEIKMLLS